MTLGEALPELVGDTVGALVRLGRGRVALQLPKATLVSWVFDDMAQATYLAFVQRSSVTVEETISLHDDIPVSVDVDKDGRVVGLDVMGYEELLARLPPSPAV